MTENGVTSILASSVQDAIHFTGPMKKDQDPWVVQFFLKFIVFHVRAKIEYLRGFSSRKYEYWIGVCFLAQELHGNASSAMATKEIAPLCLPLIYNNYIYLG